MNPQQTEGLTAEQIAEGWIAYTGKGEAPFKKSLYGPPFQLGRMHDGELCTTGVITESLPDEINWSEVAAYRVWAPCRPQSSLIKVLTEALETAKSLVDCIEQTSNNRWVVCADDPEVAVTDTYTAIESALALVKEAN